jgi:hypothetical protein
VVKLKRIAGFDGDNKFGSAIAVNSLGSLNRRLQLFRKFADFLRSATYITGGLRDNPPADAPRKLRDLGCNHKALAVLPFSKARMGTGQAPRRQRRLGC